MAAPPTTGSPTVTVTGEGADGSVVHGSVGWLVMGRRVS
jgi:hypothetical protein